MEYIKKILIKLKICINNIYMNKSKCGCCNTCDPFNYKNEYLNNSVYSNIINGCLLCNNAYYNENNKKIYERSFFNGVIIPPCNTVCQVDLEFKLKNGQKS